MSLTTPTADSLAEDICTALEITDPDAIDRWKAICGQFYVGDNGIKLQLIITLLTGTVVTNGGPATQTGPAVPVV